MVFHRLGSSALGPQTITLSSLLFKSLATKRSSNGLINSGLIDLRFKRFHSSLKNENNEEEKNLPQSMKEKLKNSLAHQRDLKISNDIKNYEISKHIPGEIPEANDLRSRIPKFPLSKENIPTLLPRPDVPKPGSNLYSMVQSLKNKAKENDADHPELIYEVESHRLYFLFCGAFALVCIIYGLLFLETATRSAYEIYKLNKEDLPVAHNIAMMIGREIVTLAIFAIPFGLAIFCLTVPTRLIRRMWYVSKNNEALIKFTTHPFLPGSATPTHVVPLRCLNRSSKSKIFTNDGFYLTLDKGTFLFLLKEDGVRIPWLVDRKGFFWGDGRLFDYLFGKESIEDADLGISYDDKIGAVNETIKLNKEKLKAKNGFGWQFKEQGKLINEDINKLSKLIKNRNNQKKSLPKD